MARDAELSFDGALEALGGLNGSPVSIYVSLPFTGAAPLVVLYATLGQLGITTSSGRGVAHVPLLDVVAAEDREPAPALHIDAEDFDSARWVGQMLQIVVGGVAVDITPLGGRGVEALEEA